MQEIQQAEQAGVGYTLTLEDLEAFNVFHVRNSSVNSKMQRQALIRFALIVSPVFLALMLLLHMPLWEALGMALLPTLSMAASIFLMTKLGYTSRIRKMVRAHYAQSENPLLLGPQILTVDAEGFSHRTEYSQTRYSWGALVKIENEPGYTYLYTGAMNAHIIPHKSVTGGNLKLLLEQIGQHYQPHKKLAP